MIHVNLIIVPVQIAILPALAPVDVVKKNMPSCLAVHVFLNLEQTTRVGTSVVDGEKIAV